MPTHAVLRARAPGRGPVPRLAAAALLAALAAGCASSPRVGPKATPTGPAAPAGGSIRVQVVEDGKTRVRVLPLEEYVAGSVLAEVSLGGMHPGSAARVARLQAVVARTYAVVNRRRHAGEDFDICSDTHCQLYRPVDTFPARLRAIVTAAVADTRGLVIVHDGQPIEALFHADCGGYTSSAGAVWGGPTPPYLQAVPDRLGPPDLHRRWRFGVAAERLRAALNRDRRTRVGRRIDRVTVVERDVAGRAVRVVLDGERTPMVRGEELRAVLSRSFGPRAIRSTRFQIRRDGGGFVFEGTGFGHGVGLCQTGAIARARAGQSIASIIQHYYTGVHLERAGRLRPTSRRRPLSDRHAARTPRDRAGAHDRRP